MSTSRTQRDRGLLPASVKPKEATMATLFSGDWLWNDERGAYDEVYEGEFLSAWGGGVEFTVTHEVAAAIVARQRELQEDDPDGFDRLAIREDGTIVLTSPQWIVDGGGPLVQENPPLGGRPHIGFGWTWGEVDEEFVDEQTQVVR
jgi:hypothetical protein